MKPLFHTALCTAFLALITSLAPSAAIARPEAYPYRAVATTGMIGDVLQNVAGDKAQVTNIIGEGIDPHLYKPTRGDLITLNRAAIIFYNGLMLEGKMADILQRSTRGNRPVIAIGQQLLDEGRYAVDTGEGQYDPHLWMDVKAWIGATQVIAEALMQFDPQNAAAYAANAQAYTQQLQALDAYAKETLATIPPPQRTLVTAHDAFAYLGRAYGIAVQGIQGINTDSEAGVRDIENIVEFLVQNQIPAVFVESSVSDKNVRALIEGARARGHSVQIGGQLFSDAMGTPGSYKGTYIGMIDHNVTTIANALGGKAPQKGFQGKLED